MNSGVHIVSYSQYKILPDVLPRFPDLRPDHCKAVKFENSKFNITLLLLVILFKIEILGNFENVQFVMKSMDRVRNRKEMVGIINIFLV